MLPKIFSYKTKSIAALSPSVSQLILSPVTKPYLEFQAGQYVKVLHHDKSESPLSIACAPNKKHEIEIILSHPDRNLQALDLLRTARSEHAFLVSGPYGKNTSKIVDLEKPLLFFVRGSGFAPVKALLEEFDRQKSLPPMHLFYGAHSRKDFLFEKFLEIYKQKNKHFNFTLSVSPSKEQDLLHKEVLTHYPNLSHLQIYASGAEEMVLSALQFFQEHGLKRKYFYSDIFDYLTE